MPRLAFLRVGFGRLQCSLFMLVLVRLSMLLLHAAASPLSNELSTIRAVPATQSHAFSTGIEGTSTTSEGNLFLCNWNPDDIYSWNQTAWTQKPGNVAIVPSTNTISLFRQISEGGQCSGTEWGNSTLYVADFLLHRVLRFRAGVDAELTVWLQNAAFNQPNDLALTPNQKYLFLSDPKWADKTGAVWRVATNDNSSSFRFPFTMGTTNGIAVSPDGTRLYVGQSKQRNIVVFDLDQSTGDLSGQRVFYQEDTTFEFDGMECDVCGNLFVTRNIGGGDVLVIDSSGKKIGNIGTLGAKPSNLAFGGGDGRTVYVSEVTEGRVVTFRAPYPGQSWCSKNPSAASCADAVKTCSGGGGGGSSQDDGQYSSSQLASAIIGTFVGTALIVIVGVGIVARRSRLRSASASAYKREEEAGGAGGVKGGQGGTRSGAALSVELNDRHNSRGTDL